MGENPKTAQEEKKMTEFELTKENAMEVLSQPYLMIDMDTCVKGYEEYDFRKGTRCEIDNKPFQLVYENGKFYLEAEAFGISAHGVYPKRAETRFDAGATINILVVKNGKLEGLRVQLPNKVHYQGFMLT